MISTLICLINNNVTDICHFAMTLCYDTAADIRAPEGGGRHVPHITWTRVIRTSKRAARLRLRSIGGLWGILQKYLGLITLAALRP